MNERIAVVTGASSGIGWEFGRQVAAQGYDLWLVARREDRLRQLASQIAAENPQSRTQVFRLNLADAAERQQLVGRMKEAANGLELIVNNAGFGAVGHTLGTPLARYDEMIELNITALTRISYEAAAILRQKGSGGIINVASTAAFQAVPYMNVYSATKAYVLSFTEALAEEMKGSGVKIMALCPGVTRTEFSQVAGVKHEDARMKYAMTAADCVRIGLADFRRGKRISITGLANRVQVFASWISPRSLVTSATAKAVRRRAE